VEWVQEERSLLIETAAALVGTERYAEFREDLESIAAQAETL
jgi:hypothetical protein